MLLNMRTIPSINVVKIIFELMDMEYFSLLYLLILAILRADKKIYIISYVHLICSFSLLVQRKRTKRKDSLSLSPLKWTSLCCSQKADASESRTLTVLRRDVFLLFDPLLGCVKWHLKNLMFF